MPRIWPAAPAAGEWYRASCAADYGITPQQASAWLREVEDRHLPAGTRSSERRKFRARLHLADLMLARACAYGHAAAWEKLWSSRQPRLRAAALGLTRDAESARELADSLLGDLFGLRSDGEAAHSRLFSYHGLGSLDAWLCTLLAQAHVNQWRRRRRQVSLDAALEQSGIFQTLLSAPNQEPAAAAAECRPLATALTSALAAIPHEARLLFGLYYLDGRTLAEIAQLLRVHESTVSRRLSHQLQRLRREVRRQLQHLGLRPAASAAVIRSAAQLDPGWLPLDLGAALRAQRAPRRAHGA